MRDTTQTIVVYRVSRNGAKPALERAIGTIASGHGGWIADTLWKDGERAIWIEVPIEEAIRFARDARSELDGKAEILS